MTSRAIANVVFSGIAHGNSAKRSYELSISKVENGFIAFINSKIIAEIITTDDAPLYCDL